MSERDIGGAGPLAYLRQLVRQPAAAEAGFCELCGVALTPQHQHLLELGRRNIVCSCDACALLFTSQAAPRFRRIPRRVRLLRDFALDDHQWDSLLIPISLAFFFHSSSAGRVLAYYPSPGGPIESLLDLEYWDAIADANPVLRQMEYDVEALLVNRVRPPFEYYVAPIDHCYRLVGVIRRHWHGLSGGSEVWKEIDAFFATLRQACPNNVSRHDVPQPSAPDQAAETVAHSGERCA